MQILMLLYAYRRCTNMHTTLNLDRDLLDEAMTLSGMKTKTDTITLALQNLISEMRLQKLKQYGGKVNLDIDLDTLRGRK